LRGTETDARGRFLIAGMPAGTYWFDVHAYVPGLMRSPPSIHQQIIITNGKTTEINFPLDLSPEPKPQP
jgi:Polysaccharide lyase family 4, domain II